MRHGAGPTLSSFAVFSVSEGSGVEKAERALSNQKLISHTNTRITRSHSSPPVLHSSYTHSFHSLPSIHLYFNTPRKSLSLFLVHLSSGDIFRRVLQGTLSPELLDGTHLFLAGTPL